MTPEPVKLTRKQLYHEIWKTPIHRLSEKYGLSDVGLAKACKRMDIPRPPRGYWRRKETGAKVTRTPLPKAQESTQLEIKFHPLPEELRGQRKRSGQNTTPAPCVKVAGHLTDPHPLVATTLKRYEKARERKDGVLTTNAKRCLTLSTSRSQLDRSLRLLDAVFKAWEERGHRIEIDVSEEDSVTLLRAGEEQIEISVTEEVKEHELEPTEDELLKPKWTWKKKIEKRPTGKLTVRLSGDRITDCRAFHRRYRDGQDAPIEDKGGRVLQAALDYLEMRERQVEREAREQAEREERQRRRELEWKRREEERRRREEEEKRKDELLSAVGDWTRSQQLREFIAACESRMTATGEEQEARESWVRWASELADGLDPLQNAPLDRFLAMARIADKAAEERSRDAESEEA